METSTLGKTLTNEEISIPLSRLKNIYESIRQGKHDDFDRTVSVDTATREILYFQIKALDAVYSQLITEIKKETKEREPNMPYLKTEDFDHA